MKDYKDILTVVKFASSDDSNSYHIIECDIYPTIKHPINKSSNTQINIKNPINKSKPWITGRNVIIFILSALFILLLIVLLKKSFNKKKVKSH